MEICARLASYEVLPSSSVNWPSITWNERFASPRLWAMVATIHSPLVMGVRRIGFIWRSCSSSLS